MLHWAQIKLSASVPTCPEGVATHTVLSYEQTPLHAVGLRWLPKARERRAVGRACVERKCGTERCNEKVRGREKKETSKWEWALRREGIRDGMRE